MQPNTLTYIYSLSKYILVVIPSFVLTGKYYVVDAVYPNKQGYLAPTEVADIIYKTIRVEVGPEDKRDI